MCIRLLYRLIYLGERHLFFLFVFVRSIAGILQRAGCKIPEYLLALKKLKGYKKFTRKRNLCLLMFFLLFSLWCGFHLLLLLAVNGSASLLAERYAESRLEWWP